ncbi:MAG: phosphotransferase [Patescibacteria group bacterium]
MDENALKRFIATSYGIEMVSVRPLGGDAVSSSVFLCTDQSGKQYVFKQSDWHQSRAPYEKAYAVSEELRARGVPLPRVYRTHMGQFVALLSEEAGERFFVLMDHIPGVPYEFSEPFSHEAGRALGLFHAQGALYLREHPEEVQTISEQIPQEKPYEESRALYGPVHREQFLSLHECELPLVCALVREKISFIDKQIEYLDRVPFDDGVRMQTVRHGDFHMGNGLYSPDGSLRGLIDIDQMGTGPALWDIGAALLSLGWKGYEAGKHAQTEEQVRTFLKAYHKENPLLPEEYELILPAAIRWDMMRVLRSLRRHHFEGNRLPELTQKIEKHLLRRIEMLPELLSFLDLPWIEKHLGKE